MKKIAPYYVLLWNFNKKEIEHYDIMPYLIQSLEDDKSRKYQVFCEGKKPETFDEYKKFILAASRYQFWCRCEYEIVVNGFPSIGTSQKIDAYHQIEMNIDIITQHFIMQLR